LILSFPCLRAEALQRAGVQTGIQAKDYKDMDSCFCRNDKESEVTLRTPNSLPSPKRFVQAGEL
jgi:hypothetical protein